jgi:hypothetical protein
METATVDFDVLHRKLDALKSERNVAHLSKIFNHHVALQNVIKITEPKEILEIGFLYGHTALMWLMFSNANVTSIDKIKDEAAEKGIEILKEHFGDRFRFLNVDVHEANKSKELKSRKYDLMFMDAGLEDEGESSFYLATAQNIPYLLFDCWKHFRYVKLLDTLKSEGKIKHIINYSTQPLILKLYKNLII